MEIKINCQKGIDLPLSEMHAFQGDLKDLSEENYQRLSEQIQEKGFLAPFSVWKDNGKWMLLDGHQRHRTLTRMEENKVTLPDAFPTIEIIAENIKQAKEIVLSLTSQYGHMSNKGLYDFMQEAQIKNLSDFRLPDINIAAFSKEFFSVDDTPMVSSNESPKDEVKFMIVIECKDELEQIDLFEELQIRKL